MRSIYLIQAVIIALLFILLVSCTAPSITPDDVAEPATPADEYIPDTAKEIDPTPTDEPMETRLEVTSPDGKIQVRFELISGVPTYAIKRLDSPQIQGLGNYFA